MTRFRDHAAAELHIAGPAQVQRMATGIEGLRVDAATLEPQPGIILAGDTGGDPLLASAHLIAMSLDVDIGQDLCAGCSGTGDHRRNDKGAVHARRSLAWPRSGTKRPGRLLRKGRGTTAIGTYSLVCGQASQSQQRSPGSSSTGASKPDAFDIFGKTGTDAQRCNPTSAICYLRRSQHLALPLPHS